ncbi:hypothetical protein QVD17_21204 [Tagetes erecta]|uniref:Reverse transcriptase zinc-binding domain-containing protein n=1 Tax=Tagetes erecta TaxID=13708 RepID=A0AAD8KQK2_TARER|nr:hypothetical protein QVD17_21204 [Tagetes erecta]
MDAFSVSSAWESTRASHPSVYWWKYVWNKWVHPKAGFFWRLMHKAISTDERMKSLGFRFLSCCLCYSSPHSKSISNLFVQGERPILCAKNKHIKTGLMPSSNPNSNNSTNQNIA